MTESLTLSGKGLAGLTIEELRSGGLAPDDFRISPQTLIAQAVVAEAAGYASLGQNFRRAAELTGLSHGQVLDIYDALRPGRKTKAELLQLADHLEGKLSAPLNAALIRDAAEVYFLRGLCA